MGRTSPFRCEGWKVGTRLPFANRLSRVGTGDLPCVADAPRNRQDPTLGSMRAGLLGINVVWSAIQVLIWTKSRFAI
jgi:hypothetical protein